MKKIYRLFKIFKKRQIISFVGLFVVQVFGATLEFLSVSILLPFIQALMNPDKLLKNRYIRVVMEWAHIDNISQLVLLLIGMMIILFIFKNVYMIFMYYIQYQIVWHNKLKMESDFMAYYIEKPYLFHTKTNSAELQRVILADVGNVFDALSSFFSLISDLITAMVLSAFLFISDKAITITVLFILFGFSLFYFKIFKKRLYSYGEIGQKYAAEVNKCILQSFKGIKEIKIYECEKYFEDEFREKRSIQLSMAKRAIFLGQMPRFFLEMLCTSGVLLVLFIRISLGASAADMVPQLAVFAMAAFKILPSFNHINSELACIYNNKASIDVIYEAVKSKRVSNNQNQQEACERNMEVKNRKIVFENVSFKYPNSHKYIVYNMNIFIEQGKSVAFKGVSGAGKTTIADLILGILPPNEGKILYGGQDISKLGKKWFSHLGYIPQNIYLSDDTIRNNVAMGIKKPDDDKIWKALKGAQLADTVKECPDGLDTRIGEAGIRLSGGQRQRIGIARALYNDPDILVMDEATAALDTETEAAVMDSINYLKGKKTLIIIAHRLSTIENCDIIYEVKDGRVINDAVQNN